MAEMPRKLPPFVTRERTRHNRVVFYFRRGKGRRVRLPDLGTAAFDEAYSLVLAGVTPAKPAAASSGTLAWLLDRYRETADYRALSPATRRQRDNIFKGVIGYSGGAPYRDVTQQDIKNGAAARVLTPSQARNFLDAMRGLFRWAFEAQLVPIDPTAGVKNPKRPNAGGFQAWSEDDVAAYEVCWSEGTKERVWLHVLLYTGLRRGDAVRLGRQHVKDGMATIKTEKSRHRLEVNIPILDVLAETLERGPTGDLAFICGENGRPLTKESFGNMFRMACNAAGVSGSAHGVRKIGATRAAEAGATVAELEALFGWTGGTMASHYTKTANRKLLSRSGGAKIALANARTLKSGAGKIGNK